MTDQQLIDALKCLMTDGDALVLVFVNGVCGNIIAVDVVSRAAYSREEGWILDEYPKWENPGILILGTDQKGTCP